MKRYTFTAKVWLYSGHAAWHFITIPKEEARVIKEAQSERPRRGWGAIRVKATIGKTAWETSIFPDKKSGSYLVPLKAEMRRREKISVNDTVRITLHI